MTIVIVSMLNPQYFKTSKDAAPILYKAGMVEMPLEHARAMGLLHRVQGMAGDEIEEGAQHVALPFDGAFDDKLARVLQAAGYESLDELRMASQDELRAVDGVGPAAYERIQNALKGS